MMLEKIENMVGRAVLGILGLAAVLNICVHFVEARGWDQAQEISRGSYIDARNVSISSTTGTALFSGSKKRADGVCRNNTTGTIWIGSVTAAVHGALHTNISQGFPVLSSETWKLDGSMSGSIFATCDEGTASCEMRCIDGLER